MKKTVLFALLMLASLSIYGQWDETNPEYILTSDKVGIGTTPNANSKLHVLGRFTVENEGIYATGNLGRLIMVAHNSYYSLPTLYSLNSDGAASNLLINPAGGNVGVGTTNPLSPLYISSLDPDLTINMKPGSTSNNSEIRFSLDNTLTSSIYWTKTDYSLRFYNGSTDAIVIDNIGNVGIGVTDTKSYKFAVAGDMVAEKVVVKYQGNWPDFVFDSKYKLKPLIELEKEIKKNKHLPGVPAADEISKNGVDISKTSAAMLEKIEELYLYTIQQQKEIIELKEQIAKQQNVIEHLLNEKK